LFQLDHFSVKAKLFFMLSLHLSRNNNIFLKIFSISKNTAKIFLKNQAHHFEVKKMD